MHNNQSRRDFVKKSLALTAAIPLLSVHAVPFFHQGESLRILILGGTSFLGPHQIACALQRGHKVTTFTRGKSEPTVHKDLFDKVEQLIGDRESDLSALEKGNWDVVIDNSGRKTEWTRKTAQLLKDRAGMYMYTSSTGVYFPYVKASVDEDDEVLLVEPEQVSEEDKLEYWYGVMKATSEVETIRAFSKERAIIVRPTYMMGPGDKSDRFIYWPVRLSRGGEVMIPGKASDPVQYIDVRDVAEWMIRLAERRTYGTFNAAGPEIQESMGAFAEKAASSFEVPTTLVQIEDYDFLKANNVRYLVPWILPEGNNFGSARINNKRAIKAGLSFRPLQQSMRDMISWWNSDALTQERRDKFEQKPNSLLVREASILDNWRKYKKQ